MTPEEARFRRMLFWILLAESPCLIGIVVITVLAIGFRELNSLYYGLPITVISLGATWLLCLKAPRA